MKAALFAMALGAAAAAAQQIWNLTERVQQMESAHAELEGFSHTALKLHNEAILQMLRRREEEAAAAGSY